MRQWRLIFSGPASGARNMAIDEALLEYMGDRPVLRFYSWQPFCLSLGYGQRCRVVDRRRLNERGYTLVRRPGGGGAILHARELTWSLVLPASHALAVGPIVTGYRRIAAVFQEALRSLGIPATLQQGQQGRRAETICFAAPAQHELLVHGRKLLGCARVQRRHALLQHGSLPLEGDLGSICDVLDYSDDQARQEAAERLGKRAITLVEAAGGRPIGANQVAAAIVDAFVASHAVEFVKSDLTQLEDKQARALEATRYGNPEWVCRR